MIFLFSQVPKNFSYTEKLFGIQRYCLRKGTCGPDCGRTDASPCHSPEKYALPITSDEVTAMRAMRKSDRQMPAQWALDVFDKAPFITVSMTRPDGTPYGLPLNLVRKKDEHTFYFHCAAEGEKIDCINHNPIVSLSAVSRCSPKYEEEKNNFTEYYDSATAIGRAEIVGDPYEKIEALRLLCERFLPKHMEHFQEAIDRSLERTTIVRISLAEPPVGKRKP